MPAAEVAAPSRGLRGVAQREAASSTPMENWWHPVSWSHDLVSAPRRTTLLGRTIVLWRDTTGAPQCLRDLCVHRGTALSLGEVTQAGELACAYHGWTFRGDGACTRIPQLPADAPIPASAPAVSFACTERYGLVWVCLGEPKADIPEFPEWDNTNYRHVPCTPYTWRSAARMVENFTDFGHLGWLHDGLPGLRSDLVVPPHRVTRQGHELRCSLTMNVPAAEGVNDTAGESGVMTNTYVLSLPHAIHLRSSYEDSGRSRVLYFAAQTLDSETSVGYCYQSRDFDLEGDDDRYREFQEILAEQDRVVVESQRPEQLPMDIADELHLK